MNFKMYHEWWSPTNLVLNESKEEIERDTLNELKRWHRNKRSL